MIETFKRIGCWYSSAWPTDKPSSHPLFLHFKAKWRPSNEIWFTTSPIGCYQLCFIIDELTINFPYLHPKKLFNKIGQGVKITWMEKALVFREYGMEITTHMDPISYGK